MGTLTIAAMKAVEVINVIKNLSFLASLACYFIYYGCLFYDSRKRNRAEEERRRDHDALQKLSGKEYWKAYEEYKKKYPK